MLSLSLCNKPKSISIFASCVCKSIEMIGTAPYDWCSIHKVCRRVLCVLYVCVCICVFVNRFCEWLWGNAIVHMNFRFVIYRIPASMAFCLPRFLYIHLFIHTYFINLHIYHFLWRNDIETTHKTTTNKLRSENAIGSKSLAQHYFWPTHVNHLPYHNKSIQKSFSNILHRLLYCFTNMSVD